MHLVPYFAGHTMDWLIMSFKKEIQRLFKYSVKFGMKQNSHLAQLLGMQSKQLVTLLQEKQTILL
jgi:hypothetical protein